MRVLIVHGSKLGGTAGIAQMIADRLSIRGLTPTVEPASNRPSPGQFDAVVVGGALYANRWHKAARRYLKKCAADLLPKPVWLFSSGPLDDSALESIPPTSQVSELIELVGARDHITFGGRLEEDAPGLIAGAMAKSQAGDWRSQEQIEDWADDIATALIRSDAA